MSAQQVCPASAAFLIGCLFLQGRTVAIPKALIGDGASLPIVNVGRTAQNRVGNGACLFFVIAIDAPGMFETI